MGKRGKLKSAKSADYSSSEEDKRRRKPPIDEDADDAEANEDLSSKIVQKSMQRAAKNDPRDDGVLEIVTNLKEERSKKEKKKRRKHKEVEVPADAVDNAKENEKPETDTAAAITGEAVETNPTVSEAVETNPVEVLDNAILRKLLRGPRYFDPPNNSWGACYNCGEEGHTSVNCTSARRKKPCFVCGSFEHNAKQCSKGRDCFICKEQGHRAKDCPEKYKTSKICLKCGDLGHEMFMCRNDYCPDDLKEIQCYTCGQYGHLCCKGYTDLGPRKVTCYRCGHSGHTGLACSASRWDTNDMVLATASASATASSCYKCGVVGHFARECTSSTKASKRNREPSTPKHKSPKKKKKENLESKSAPHDIGKSRKKKPQSIEFSSPAKPKHRGGWITEDPEDYYTSISNNNYWRSPATPRDRKSRIPYSNGDYASRSHSSQNHRKINYHDSPANGSSRYSHNPRMYSASRFGNNSYGGSGRNNDWW